MKYHNHIFVIYACIGAITLLYISSIQASSASQSFLSADVVSSTQAGLIRSVPSYPALGIIETQDGTVAYQMIPSRTTKHTIPYNTIPLLKYGNFSCLKGSSTDTMYGSGSTLFPNYATLAAKFDAIMAIIKQIPNSITVNNAQITVTASPFIHFFNKVHLNILNELYSYLMNIYTNFNLQHVGVTQNTTNNNVTINIVDFLTNELSDDTNKKTLIINHLINVIESQMNGRIQALMPNIPTLFATTAGKTLIQNDYSIDLTDFIVQQTESDLQQYQKTYLANLATYISFFQEFTSYLTQPSTQTNYSEFVTIAQGLSTYLSSLQNPSQPPRINPPLFIFSYDDIRALKIIPTLAQNIGSSSQSISWPAHIVSLAESQTLINGHPMAYFKDASGNITTDSSTAEHLYVIIASGSSFYQEEVLSQPSWLNSSEGVMDILAACFGDFSRLLKYDDIIDPCMTAILQNALASNNPSAQQTASAACQSFITELSTTAKPSSSTAGSITPSSIPSIPGMPTTNPSPFGPPSSSPSSAGASPFGSPGSDDISGSPFGSPTSNN